MGIIPAEVSSCQGHCSILCSVFGWQSRAFGPCRAKIERLADGSSPGQSRLEIHRWNFSLDEPLCSRVQTHVSDSTPLSYLIIWLSLRFIPSRVGTRQICFQSGARVTRNTPKIKNNGCGFPSLSVVPMMIPFLAAAL